MRFLNYSLLLALISCGSGEVRKNVDENSYRTSGVEQYFLPELPAWANHSAQGACFKANSYHYLDFPKLQASYNLTYQEMVELQAQYNERLESYFRSTAVRFVKPVEEASFFANTLEQVRAGIKQFKLPVVPEIDVIWLDSFIASGKGADLKKMADAGRFNTRLPVIFSSCLSKGGLNQWLSENNLDQVGFYLLSAEWLNPYGSDLTLKPGLRIELKKLINQELKINVISHNNITTNELITQ